MQDISFLLPGRTCECDLDYRCDAHDDEAEDLYWKGLYLHDSVRIVEVDAGQRDAYEPGDPKAFEL